MPEAARQSSLFGGTIGESFTRDGSRVTKHIALPNRSIDAEREVPSSSSDIRGDWLRGFLAGTPITVDAPQAPPVRTVELFCGPGGLGLGFGEACRELGTDLESEACVDPDAGAVGVYAANHGTKLRSTQSASEIVDYQIKGRGDAAEYFYEPEMIGSEWEGLVGRVDAILAGPPCQGHSNLNNHTRRVDARNELYLTVPAAAVALGADIVVIENVTAVVHDSSQVVATTRALLRNAGYKVTEGVFSAPDMGWPQSRKRYFLIARRSAAPIEIADVSEALRDETTRGALWAIEDLVDKPFDDRLQISTAMSEENQRRIEYLFEHDLYNLPNSERPDCHKDGTTYGSVYGRMYPDRPAPTITTGFMTPGRGRFIHPLLPRTLTPWEAARIQGFPDTYNFFPDPANPPTKSKLAKWIGDAVPSPLGYAAGISALGNGWSR